MAGFKDVFPDWQRYAVMQKNPVTGCIPAAYEMLLQSRGVTGVDYKTFQDEVDLGPQHNNFGTVADRVKAKYSWIEFRHQGFESGAEKVDFIDKCNREKRVTIIALVVGLQMIQDGFQYNVHAMPIIAASDDEYLLLRARNETGFQIMRVPKAAIVKLHDGIPLGRDVAWLLSP